MMQKFETKEERFARLEILAKSSPVPTTKAILRNIKDFHEGEISKKAIIEFSEENYHLATCLPSRTRSINEWHQKQIVK